MRWVSRLHSVLLVLLLVLGLSTAVLAASSPPSAHTLFLQAREAERAGKDAEALNLYRQAFSRDNRNRDLCFLYLERLKGTGSIDSAYALGNRCASLKGKPSLSEYKMLGELALRTNHDAVALGLYEEAHKLDEEDGDVLYVLAGLYEDAQDWANYVEATGALLPRLGYPAPLMERQLRAYGRLDQPVPALELLKAAWRETARVPYGQALASYYDGRGMPVSLLAVARALVAAEPTPENQWLLARAYASADRADSALMVCEGILERDPTDANVLYFYTYLLFDRGRYAEAYASARKLVKINATVSAYPFLEGSAALELRKSEARKTLEKAVALSPLAPDYRARLAYADYVFNKPSKDRLVYVVTDSLKAEQALLLEGFAQGQLARLLDPRETWERPAIYSDTIAAKRHRLLAVERFEKFLTADSSNQGAAGKRAAQFELASHLERLGEHGRAKGLLRGLVRQDTTNAIAHNYLGYMLIENLPVDSADLVEAGALLDRALALEPENGAYLDSKGWWYYRAGMLDSARTYLERASQTILSDPAILGHLAEVLQAQNRNAEACTVLQEMRRKDPKGSKRTLPAACSAL